MSKEFAREFYNSTAWKRCREEYKKKAVYLCERCGRPGDIVHHKRRVSPETINDASVLLNFDNLELLCRQCHADEHAGERDGKSWRRYYFDENGKCIAKE